MEMEATLNEITPGLLRLALGLSGNRHDAEDLVQEALSSLIRYWRKQGPPDSPAAFTCTVVRRQALRYGKMSRRTEPLDITQDTSGNAAPLEDSIQKKLQLETALSALAGMESQTREAILLVAAGGLKIEETASILGISLSACKMKIHRARRRLAEVMEQKNGREKGQRKNAV